MECVVKCSREHHKSAFARITGAGRNRLRATPRGSARKRVRCLRGTLSTRRSFKRFASVPALAQEFAWMASALESVIDADVEDARETALKCKVITQLRSLKRV